MENNAFFEHVALWSQVAGAVAFLLAMVVIFRKSMVPAVVANQQARNAEIAEAETRRARMQGDAAKARVEVATAARYAARDRLRVEFIEKALAKARAEAPARVDDTTNRRLVETTLADLVQGKPCCRTRRS